MDEPDVSTAYTRLTWRCSQLCPETPPGQDAPWLGLLGFYDDYSATTQDWTQCQMDSGLEVFLCHL